RTASRPASMARRLALIGEAFGQSPPQMARLAVILVIAGRLSRRGDVKDMMDVVVPLRRIVKRFAILPNEPAGLVVLVLEQQVDRPLEARPDAFGELVVDIGPRVVLDGVDGVEPQPVEMELVEPVFGVLDDEVAHRTRGRTVEV